MPLRPLELRETVSLDDWQVEARDAWRLAKHPERGTRHGILQAVTGTGKSIAAMACMVDASREAPELRFAIVVPGQELARQWKRELLEVLDLAPSEIGLRMTGESGSLRSCRIVVYVVNSARTHLAKDASGLPVMLVVDECHRTATAENRKIFETTTRFRLGLSATADRARDTDEAGIKLPLEQQVHARALGPSFYRMTVADAERRGILPPFQLVHHGITLSPDESAQYEAISRRLRTAQQEMEQLGVNMGMLTQAASGKGARWNPRQIEAARRVHALILERKHFLYLRPERNRVAGLLLAEAFRAAGQAGQDLQAILFNERIRPSTPKAQAADDAEPVDDVADDEDDTPEEAPTLPAEGADALYARLIDLHRAGGLAIGGTSAQVIRLHHSAHPDPEAIRAMKHARVDDPARPRVLVSVKGATEGIDLPNADLGMIVASTSSVLQRIQTLGRILRPRRVKGEGNRLYRREEYAKHPLKTLHVLYVKGTVDEEIYHGTDWDQLLGRERNLWRVWPFGEEAGVDDVAPPTPPMSEEEAWAWVQAQRAAGKEFPMLWPSRVPEAQEIRFSGNAIRVQKGGPVVHNSAAIEALVTRAAARLKLDEVRDLRSVMHVSLKHRLLLKRLAPGLVPGVAAVDPRTGTPLRGLYLVLGVLDELPRVAPPA